MRRGAQQKLQGIRVLQGGQEQPLPHGEEARGLGACRRGDLHFPGGGTTILLASGFILNLLCWETAFQKSSSIGENLLHFNIPLAQSFSLLILPRPFGHRWPQTPSLLPGGAGEPGVPARCCSAETPASEVGLARLSPRHPMLDAAMLTPLPACSAAGPWRGGVPKADVPLSPVILWEKVPAALPQHRAAAASSRRPEQPLAVSLGCSQAEPPYAASALRAEIGVIP